MIKKNFLVVVAMTSLLALGACSSSGTSNNSKSEAQKSSVAEGTAQQDAPLMPPAIHKSFNYEPPVVTNGKLSAVVEMGATGFNSFIIERDSKAWSLVKAEYGTSSVIEGGAQDEEIRVKLQNYIKSMIDQGVPGKYIYFVVSSGAAKEPIVKQITRLLKEKGYVVNQVTANQEAAYGYKATVPTEYQDKSFFVDMGSGNTKIAYMQDGKLVTHETFGAKYYKKDASDEEVAQQVRELAAQIPASHRQHCFMIGGIPYDLAKFQNGGNTQLRYITVLFGDVKQNIYGQSTQNKDVVTNVRGVNDLKYCYRSDFKVRDLAQSFQKNIFKDKYDVDDFSENGTYSFFSQEQEKEGYINYMYLQEDQPVTTLYNIIRGNILNKNSNISPNDITILGYTTSLLRTFDLYYRYASREKTNSMIETVEIMYMTHLNYIGKNSDNDPHSGWFNNICEHFKKKLFPNRQKLYDNDIIKVRQHVAMLFSIYDLSTNFADTFDSRLAEECQKCGISIDAFKAFRKHYAKILDRFKQEVYSDSYKNIRDNKKLHFWMNSGTLKISTINSFKGWESEVVFLILEPKYESSTSFNLSIFHLMNCYTLVSLDAAVILL